MMSKQTKATKRMVAEFLELQLTFAFYPAEDRKGIILAHCLELDVVGQGKDQAAARAALQEAIEIYVQYKLDCGEIQRLYSPAPAGIWNMKTTERWRHGVLIRVYPVDHEVQAEVRFLPGGTLLPTTPAFPAIAHAGRC